MSRHGVSTVITPGRWPISYGVATGLHGSSASAGCSAAIRHTHAASSPYSRRIFTERLPDIVAPSARRTSRLTACLLAMGLALGRAAGVRLRRQSGLMVSRHNLLWVIHRTLCPVIIPPQGFSVDDFALRKRHPYSTLLLDLARWRSLARLPEREAATVVQWLQAHPGVEVSCRIARGHTRKGHASELPWRVRWPTAFIYCRIWPAC
jgi:transposase